LGNCDVADLTNFPVCPAGWTTDGWTFFEDYANDGDEPYDHPGIWHVTTAAEEVARDGRLLSRRELAAKGITTGGLGGGAKNVASDKISATTNPHAAQRVYRTMQIAALAAQNRLPAWRVATEALTSSDLTNLLYEYDNNAEAHGYYDDDPDDPAAHEYLRLLAEILGVGTRADLATPVQIRMAADALEARYPDGAAKYGLFQAVEQVGADLHYHVVNEYDEHPGTNAPVGFTEPWAKWAKVNPRNIRLLRLAACPGARVDIEPSENELRFDPEDLRVVGVESLKGLTNLADAPRKLRLRNPTRKRNPAPMNDYYRIYRGSLTGQGQTIPVKRIGKGTFATVYRDLSNPGRVFVVVPDDVYDKEIAAEVHRDDPNNQHVPHVTYFGDTAEARIYTMPHYKMPLRKADLTPKGWADYKEVRECWEGGLEAVRRKRGYGNVFIHSGFEVLDAVVECATEKGVSEPLLEALSDLRDTAANYGASYTFEISPRNVGSDGAQNLVLVDVLFDMIRLKQAQQESDRRRRRNPAPGRKRNPAPDAPPAPPAGPAPPTDLLARTRTAVAAWDKADAAFGRAPTVKQLPVLDKLRAAIGAAFALDTADRNEPAVTESYVESPAGLAFVRQMLVLPPGEYTAMPIPAPEPVMPAPTPAPAPPSAFGRTAADRWLRDLFLKNHGRLSQAKLRAHMKAKTGSLGKAAITAAFLKAKNAGDVEKSGADWLWEIRVGLPDEDDFYFSDGGDLANLPTPVEAPPEPEEEEIEDPPEAVPTPVPDPMATLLAGLTATGFGPGSTNPPPFAPPDGWSWVDSAKHGWTWLEGPNDVSLTLRPWGNAPDSVEVTQSLAGEPEDRTYFTKWGVQGSESGGTKAAYEYMRRTAHALNLLNLTTPSPWVEELPAWGDSEAERWGWYPDGEGVYPGYVITISPSLSEYDLVVYDDAGVALHISTEESVLDARVAATIHYEGIVPPRALAPPAQPASGWKPDPRQQSSWLDTNDDTVWVERWTSPDLGMATGTPGSAYPDAWTVFFNPFGVTDSTIAWYFNEDGDGVSPEYSMGQGNQSGPSPLPGGSAGVEAFLLSKWGIVWSAASHAAPQPPAPPAPPAPKPGKMPAPTTQVEFLRRLAALLADTADKMEDGTVTQKRMTGLEILLKNASAKMAKLPQTDP
jgi:hypothetical protein